LFAQLSCCYTWKEDWLKALDYATAAALLGKPSEGPGAMVQALVLLRDVFERVGLHTEADMAGRVKAPYSPSPGSESERLVRKATEALASRDEEEVRWAADMVREKLADALGRCSICGSKIDHFGFSPKQSLTMQGPSGTSDHRNTVLMGIGGTCSLCEMV
jgi:hypothetical protein